MSCTNGAQNNSMPVNNSSLQPYTAQSQQQQIVAQYQTPHQAQGQQQEHGQDQPASSRRKLPSIGRGLLPLSDGLSVQEYERRRQHNSRQAEENKKEQRERNNEAARRSRQRRADLIENQAAQIQRLKEENGALVRERDYWKGVVERMQGGMVSVGHNQQYQQSDQPLSQQHSTTSQYLAHPVSMTPSTSIASAALGHMSASPTARQQMQTFRYPNTAQSQMMTQFPASAPAQPRAQASAMVATSHNNAQNSNSGTKTRASAASGHAENGFAGFPPHQTAVGTAEAAMASGAVGGLDDADFFRQLEDYDADLQNEESGDPLANFDFSID
ncbi:hypothetical protein PG993_003211 [Apiospora rasikravindrae]|uniref:BZIP domain-containing protein n=1 Tax=Apiospora rasikravindrae TaxID=990691 RepID=A0ABR1TYU2_9PEZI